MEIIKPTLRGNIPDAFSFGQVSFYFTLKFYSNLQVHLNKLEFCGKVHLFQ